MIYKEVANIIDFIIYNIKSMLINFIYKRKASIVEKMRKNRLRWFVRVRLNMRTAGMCVEMWEIASSEDLEQRWPVLNSWYRGEEEEEEEENNRFNKKKKQSMNKKKKMNDVMYMMAYYTIK